MKRVMQNWGPRITAIPVLCTGGGGGVMDIGLYEGTVNAATFQDFVTEKLCPNLLPFNGVNPRSVVILGNGDPCVLYNFFVSSFSFTYIL